MRCPRENDVTLEQSISHLVSLAARACTLHRRSGAFARGQVLCAGSSAFRPKSLRIDFISGYGARLHPREGDERLSGSRQNRSDNAGKSSDSGKGGASEKKDRKQRTDVGRALRTVYDDTLREDVPDDFLDLLGKLS